VSQSNSTRTTLTADPWSDSQNAAVRTGPKVYVLLLKQDDPRKCTASRLARLRLATPLHRFRQIPRGALVLDPTAPRVLLRNDAQASLSCGLVGVDCSWEKADRIFEIRIPGQGRHLPTLLASNPVNYGKQHKLSSVEALAASLHIMGFKEKAAILLAPFKWGNTFWTLNHEPLKTYSSIDSPEAMLAAEAQYF
jgi:pre-rRNA-processing protein TSR3